MDTETVQVAHEGQELQTQSQPPQRTPSVGSRNSIAASKLCASGPKFVGWAVRNNVSFIDEMWSNEEFDNFMSSLKYPACMKEDAIYNSVQELLSTFDPGSEVLDEFEIWRDSLRPEQFEDGDRYVFRLCLSHIFVLWTVVTSKLRSSGNEATIRAPLDCMSTLAFDERPGGGHMYRLEMDLVLPGTPDIVRADAVATKSIPKNWEEFITRRGRPWHFSWAYSRLPMSVITFVVEDKVDDLETAERQIQMGFFSAQKQRRALTMKDGPVFGAILNDGSLLFYVSFWDTNKLIIKRVLQSYNLRGLECFVEAYFVLCRIAEFQSRWLDNEFKRWDEDRKSRKVQLKQSEAKNWRNENKRNLGITNMQDAEGDSEDSEEDTIEDLEEAELDDDQDVKCSRSTVAQDPSPKDGYSLTRKRLYVLTKMPEESQAVRASPLSEWVKCTDESAG